jgi:hypothetical protein
MSTRDPVEFEPPGPNLTGLMSNDIDMTTGQPYPDYLQRRRQRAEADGSPEPKLCGILKHDCHPDD